MGLKIKHFATALHLRNKISKCSDSQIQPVLNFKVTHQPYTTIVVKRADAVCAISRLASVHASTVFLHFAVKIDIYDE